MEKRERNEGRKARRHTVGKNCFYSTIGYDLELIAPSTWKIFSCTRHYAWIIITRGTVAAHPERYYHELNNELEVMLAEVLGGFRADYDSGLKIILDLSRSNGNDFPFHRFSVSAGCGK